MRDFIIDVARGSEDLRVVQGPLLAKDSGEYALSKDSIFKKVKRLSPGEASTIGCNPDRQGDPYSLPDRVADVVCGHWDKVFSHSDCNRVSLRIGLSSRFLRPALRLSSRV